MIVFNLRCVPAAHVFECWFDSAAGYEQQQAKGLVACPACGATDVTRAPTAPRLARKGNQNPARSSGTPVNRESSDQRPVSAGLGEALAKIADAQAAALKNSEWVGGKFSEEARAIHYGETEQRAIHGETTPQEARALHEEGVPVAPLLVPFVPPEVKN